MWAKDQSKSFTRLNLTQTHVIGEKIGIQRIKVTSQGHPVLNIRGIIYFFLFF